MNFVLLNRYLAVLLLATVFIISGCSGSNNKQAAPANPMPPTPVKVLKLESADRPFYSTYIAQAEGSNAVEVRAQVSGILMTQNYTAGQFVKAGDLMFTIAPDIYQTAVVNAEGVLAQANATLTQNKENYERIKNLYAQSAVSKKDYDNALAGYESAKASVESAKAILADAEIKLGYTKVAAPISGYASKANYSIGNLISTSASSPLTYINTVDPIYINFAIPASTLSLWRNLQAQNKMRIDNNTVQVILDDGSVYKELGDVNFIDKRIDPTTGDVQIRAEFKNPNNVILPGQHVNIKLLGNVLVNAVVIPQKAILQLKTGQMAITVDENNKASYVPVSLGMNLGNNFLVGDGLKSGDTIIIEGLNKVIPGSTVNPIFENAQEAAVKPVPTGKQSPTAK